MKKLITLMKNLPENLDGALITSDVNRRYYTEFPSSAGTVVVTREQSYLIIDSRYFEAASEKARNCEVILQDKLTEQIIELFKKHNVKKVGIENATLTLARYTEMQKEFEAFELIADDTLSNFINNQRAVKSDEEKKYIQLSQDITDKTFAYALTLVKAGKTEKEIALEMEFFSRENGSEEAAFSFIVASGPNTSRPHAVPGERIVEKGDFVLMDFGSTYKGYRSDMTRTVAVGEPSAKQKEVYNTVLEAQLKAMAMIKAGAEYKKVHNTVSEFINSTEYAGKFNHGLGHSLGLDIHEPPNFNPITEGNAVVGNVMSVEPGIYLPGEFGVRIEDIIYITEEGFYNFTGSPKELIVL